MVDVGIMLLYLANAQHLCIAIVKKQHPLVLLVCVVWCFLPSFFFFSFIFIALIFRSSKSCLMFIIWLMLFLVISHIIQDLPECASFAWKQRRDVYRD